MSRILVLFDFDGTLCKIDSFTGFCRFAFPLLHFYLKCLPILPNITSYYLGYLPANQTRPKVFHALFNQQPKQKIDALAQKYAQDIYQNHLNLQLLEQLQWHKEQGHHICIVSASVDIYLKYIAQQFNIDLICTETKIKESYYTGDYHTADCNDQEKVNRIKAQFDINDFAEIYAYGNSPEDYAMLKLASTAYWVDRNHQLHSFQN